MAYLCFTACNGNRFGTIVNSNCTAAGMETNVYRLSGNWTSQGADGYTMRLIENGMPVRFDYIAGWFFCLSAIFHSFPVFIGPFDRFAFLYWQPMDAAFCYWRWLECACHARTPTHPHAHDWH